MTKKKDTKKKKINIEQPEATNTKFVGYFSIFVFILAAIIVFYPPFFRGLFFSEDIFIYHIVTAIVFMLVCIEKIYRQDYTFLSTPLDWAVFAYALAYLLSITGAVHKGEAVYGFLKALNWFMVFWIVSNAVKNYTYYVNMLRVILASALGVAAIGILAATGYYNYPAAFDETSKVILSTLQYPNTTAAFLAAATLIGVTLWTWEKRRYLRPLYSLTCYLLVLVALVALSKGAWIAFVLGALLLLAGMLGVNRLKSIYVLIILVLAVAATVGKFLNAVGGDDPLLTILYLIIGLLIVVAGEAVWETLAYTYRRWGSKAAIILLAILLALTILAEHEQISKVSHYVHEINNTNLIGEYNSLKDTKDNSYSSRTDLYHWAGAMIKDHPLIGAGAGGWNALYHRYQDYLSWTTEVHSHFLQVAVETGIIGLTAFLSIWLILLYFMIKRKRWRRPAPESEDESSAVAGAWVLNWGTAVAALALGAHAAIDFDLSLGAMMVLLWTLFALVNAGAKIDGILSPTPYRQPWTLIAAGVILTAVLFIAGSRMYMAQNLFVNSDRLLTEVSSIPDSPSKNKKIEQAEFLAAQAMQLDPFNARYPALYAQAGALHFASLAPKKDPAAEEYRDKTRAAIIKAEKLSPYDIKVRGALINSAIIIQDPDEVVHQVRYLVEANPNDNNAYENAIKVTMSAAQQFRNSGKPEKEARALKQVAAIYQTMVTQQQRANQERIELGYWQGDPLNLAPDTQLNVAMAYYLLGKYQEARAIMDSLMSGTNGALPTAPDAQAWRLASIYKTGAQVQANTEISPLRQSAPQTAALFDALIQLKPLK